jgi:tetratricopeptide (TPR) repeat protein
MFNEDKASLSVWSHWTNFRDSARHPQELCQHDYASAIRDEAQAIQLDPKLARAYFLRGAAFGGLGDSHNSLSDIVTALRLDPSLERYVTFKGEDASLTLPP